MLNLIRPFLALPPPVRPLALPMRGLTALLFGFLIVLSSGSAFADALKLTDPSREFPVGSYSYVTPDPNGTVSLNTLVENFQTKGLKGDKSESDLLHHPLSDAPFWILFELENSTDEDEWVLDFSDALGGRMALARSVMVMNVTTGTVFALSPGLKLPGVPGPYAQEPAQVFLGPSLPLTLKPKATNLLAVYLHPDKGFPISFTPQVLSQKKYLSVLLSGELSVILGGLFFVIVMAVFTTFLYMTRQSSYLFFLLYYASLCVLYFILNQTFLSGSLVSGPLLIGLYSAGVIFALLHIKSYLRIEGSDHPVEHIIILGLCALVVAASCLFLFVLGPGALGFGLFAGSLCVSILAGITICYFLNPNMRESSQFFCAGWLVHLCGFAALCLGAYDILPMSVFIVNLFWFSLIPQAAFFVGGSLRALKYEEEQKKQDLVRQKHDSQAMARLQKSKESADQARLLRVIERERELMSELREREIQRAEEMRHAKEVADRANMAKSAFLAVVSHEIRTPMTGIMGMVSLLNDTNLNKTQTDYVDTIKKSGETMMTLLNDILDFEKIERGSMDIEDVPFDLPRLAQDVVTLMSGHAAQKNLYLKLEMADGLPQIVSGDPTRIRQILLNLVNNGLKFTPEGGVTIKLSARKPGKKENYPAQTVLVSFAVADTGIGITKEAQTKLFTPFSQAETSITRKYGGTGLGLAISDRLIDAMDGKITVTSEVGKGTEFSFELPMLQDLSGEEVAEPLSDQELVTPPMRILVVEDNEMNRKVLQGLLGKYGHDVLLAANGFEALEQCEKEKPQLVFMDIQMQGMDGLETSRKIRSSSNTALARTPIIALTGNVMLEEMREIFEAQINGFVAKPIDPRKLNEVIYNASKGKFENPLPDISEKGEFESLTEKDLGLSLDDRELYMEKSQSTALSVSAKNTVAEPEDKSKEFSFDEFRKKIEEDDEEDADPLDYGEDLVKEGSALSASKKRKNDLSFNDDEELTEIQKFLMAQHSGDSASVHKSSSGKSARAAEPLFKTEKKAARTDDAPKHSPQAKSEPMSKPQKTEKKGDSFLDLEMLKSLVDTLGKDQFTKLLEGFLSKADEIVEQIKETLEKKDVAGLAARSHELKGMAANFGMAEVSKIAGEAEKASKTSNPDLAFKKAALLEESNKNTKIAFTKWLDGLK
jgi:signal transduction histidine kinase/DNA-binding response OmpR family regulator/HPt (histidine-containing phosphotransfer) domain-containing protein